MQFNIPAEYKHASGVYIIRNTLNDKVYVGSAVNFRKRYGLHRRMLELGKHHSAHLQSFAKRYGLDSLSFDLLEPVVKQKELILQCEQKWINYYQCYLRTKGFNISPSAASCAGIKQSEEVKKAKSIALKGLKRNAVSRARMSEAARQRPKRELTDEQRRKAASQLAGRLTPEAEQKRLENLRAYHAAQRALKPPKAERLPLPPGYKRPPLSEESKQKISAARKGRKFSDETKQKMSESAKRRLGETKSQQNLNSPESVAKRVATIKAKPSSKQTNSPEQLTLPF